MKSKTIPLHSILYAAVLVALAASLARAKPPSYFRHDVGLAAVDERPLPDSLDEAPSGVAATAAAGPLDSLRRGRSYFRHGPGWT